MAKKITFGANLKDKQGKTKKNQKILSDEADKWVKGVDLKQSAKTSNTAKKSPAVKQKEVAPSKKDEKLVKFTIDIPISLRTKIKTKCAIENVPMRERVQQLLEDYFDK